MKQKQQNELRECTFKPKINRSKNYSITKKRTVEDLYQWQERRDKKIAEVEQEVTTKGVHSKPQILEKSKKMVSGVLSNRLSVEDRLIQKQQEKEEKLRKLREEQTKGFFKPSIKRKRKSKKEAEECARRPPSGSEDTGQPRSRFNNNQGKNYGMPRPGDRHYNGIPQSSFASSRSGLEIENMPVRLKCASQDSLTVKSRSKKSFVGIENYGSNQSVISRNLSEFGNQRSYSTKSIKDHGKGEYQSLSAARSSKDLHSNPSGPLDENNNYLNQLCFKKSKAFQKENVSRNDDSQTGSRSISNTGSYKSVNVVISDHLKAVGHPQSHVSRKDQKQLHKQPRRPPKIPQPQSSVRNSEAPTTRPEDSTNPHSHKEAFNETPSNYKKGKRFLIGSPALQEQGMSSSSQDKSLFLSTEVNPHKHQNLVRTKKKVSTIDNGAGSVQSSSQNRGKNKGRRKGRNEPSEVKQFNLTPQEYDTSQNNEDSQLDENAFSSALCERVDERELANEFKKKNDLKVHQPQQDENLKNKNRRKKKTKKRSAISRGSHSSSSKKKIRMQVRVKKSNGHISKRESPLGQNSTRAERRGSIGKKDRDIVSSNQSTVNYELKEAEAKSYRPQVEPYQLNKPQAGKKEEQEDKNIQRGILSMRHAQYSSRSKNAYLNSTEKKRHRQNSDQKRKEVRVSNVKKNQNHNLKTSKQATPKKQLPSAASQRKRVSGVSSLRESASKKPQKISRYQKLLSSRKSSLHQPDSSDASSAKGRGHLSSQRSQGTCSASRQGESRSKRSSHNQRRSQMKSGNSIVSDDKQSYVTLKKSTNLTSRDKKYDPLTPSRRMSSHQGNHGRNSVRSQRSEGIRDTWEQFVLSQKFKAAADDWGPQHHPSYYSSLSKINKEIQYYAEKILGNKSSQRSDSSNLEHDSRRLTAGGTSSRFSGKEAQVSANGTKRSQKISRSGKSSTNKSQRRHEDRKSKYSDNLGSSRHHKDNQEGSSSGSNGEHLRSSQRRRRTGNHAKRVPILKIEFIEDAEAERRRLFAKKRKIKKLLSKDYYKRKKTKIDRRSDRNRSEEDKTKHYALLKSKPVKNHQKDEKRKKQHSKRSKQVLESKTQKESKESRKFSPHPKPAQKEKSERANSNRSKDSSTKYQNLLRGAKTHQHSHIKESMKQPGLQNKYFEKFEEIQNSSPTASINYYQPFENTDDPSYGNFSYKTHGGPNHGSGSHKFDAMTQSEAFPLPPRTPIDLSPTESRERHADKNSTISSRMRSRPKPSAQATANAELPPKSPKLYSSSTFRHYRRSSMGTSRVTVGTDKHQTSEDGTGWQEAEKSRTPVKRGRTSSRTSLNKATGLTTSSGTNTQSRGYPILSHRSASTRKSREDLQYEDVSQRFVKWIVGEEEAEKAMNLKPLKRRNSLNSSKISIKKDSLENFEPKKLIGKPPSEKQRKNQYGSPMFQEHEIDSDSLDLEGLDSDHRLEGALCPFGEGVKQGFKIIENSAKRMALELETSQEQMSGEFMEGATELASVTGYQGIDGDLVLTGRRSVRLEGEGKDGFSGTRLKHVEIGCSSQPLSPTKKLFGSKDQFCDEVPIKSNTVDEGDAVQRRSPENNPKWYNKNSESSQEDQDYKLAPKDQDSESKTPTDTSNGVEIFNLDSLIANRITNPKFGGKSPKKRSRQEDSSLDSDEDGCEDNSNTNRLSSKRYEEKKSKGGIGFNSISIDREEIKGYTNKNNLKNQQDESNLRDNSGVRHPDYSKNPLNKLNAFRKQKAKKREQTRYSHEKEEPQDKASYSSPQSGHSKTNEQVLIQTPETKTRKRKREARKKVMRFRPNTYFNNNPHQALDNNPDQRNMVEERALEKNFKKNQAKQRRHRKLKSEVVFDLESSSQKKLRRMRESAGDGSLTETKILKVTVKKVTPILKMGERSRHYIEERSQEKPKIYDMDGNQRQKNRPNVANEKEYRHEPPGRKEFQNFEIKKSSYVANDSYSIGDSNKREHGYQNNRGNSDRLYEAYSNKNSDLKESRYRGREEREEVAFNRDDEKKRSYINLKASANQLLQSGLSSKLSEENATSRASGAPKGKEFQRESSRRYKKLKHKYSQQRRRDWRRGLHFQKPRKRRVDFGKISALFSSSSCSSSSQSDQSYSKLRKRLDKIVVDHKNRNSRNQK